MRTWPFPTSGDTAAAPPPPRPGKGTLLTVGAMGFAYSAPAGGPGFNHPWRPFLNAFRISFTRGTVNGIFTPSIRVGGALVPMDGDGGAPPQLTLAPGVANAAGESWCALEVEPTDGGEITAETRLEIVHTAAPHSRAVSLGRQPLVMILWKDRRPVRALPICHFNLNYVRVIDPIGARHFFL